MILEEISVGEDIESRKTAILSNMAQHAIINDEHLGLGHCQISDKDFDEQTYCVKFGDGRGVSRLHYHDLKSLIIIRNSPHYPRPEIDRKN